jgi:beta-lactamase regulating signal transducer with metallopeptidase domain
MISSLLLADVNGFVNLSPAIEALGWTLLHFVWQGALLGLVLAGFLGIWRQASPQIRYLAGCSALALMFLGALATFAWQMAALKRRIIEEPIAKPIVAVLTQVTSPSENVGKRKPADVVAASSDSNERDVLQDHRSAQVLPSIPLSIESRQSSVSSVSDPTSPAPQWPELLRPWLSWIVGLWALGAGVLVLRLAAGWGVILRLRAQGERPKDPTWSARLDRLRVRLGVSAPVRLLSSASATVPMVIGWIRPVVLVPAGLLTGLSASQLEAILAHELAHIRRHDYLVNLLQNVVETLFFYHPAVWWVSRHIRTEREHCCDDLAADVCGSTLDYALALTALAELRQTSGALGLAATGGSLVGRIARLAGISAREPRAGWPFPVLVLLTAAAITCLAANGSGQSGDRQQIMPKQEGEQIDAIVVEGNTTIPTPAILQKLKTQPGRKATEGQISEDLRALIRTRWFFTVEPKYRRIDKGLVLVIAVIERPLVDSVTYLGANEIKIKKLTEETGLKVGQPYDTSANQIAAKRLENFYHQKGYTEATVDLIKGDKPDQRDVIFRIHEGVSQKVIWRYFVGNSAVSGERLATELKTPPAYVFNFGTFDPNNLSEDVARIRKYYENLGYLDATVKPTVEYSKDRKWVYLRYTVHEGRHCKIRNFSMLGDTRFKTAELRTTIKTHEGRYYNAFQIQKDIEKIKKKYDVLGCTDMTVEVAPREPEQPGIVDLILRVNEDKPYYIGRVTIYIKGDHPRTKRALAYNHLEVEPGELADPAKIKKSEKKLSGAQGFKTDPDAFYLRAEEHRRRSTARILRTTQVAEMPKAGPEPRSVQLQGPPSRIRRIRIRSRSGNEFNMSSHPAANRTPPEQVTILTGGVTVLIEGLDQRVGGKPVGTIELSADRVAIWSRGELAGSAGRDDGVVQSQDEPFDVYLEGNVVIIQGDPTNPQLMRKVHANAATFDAREKKGLLLEAELEACFHDAPQSASVETCPFPFVLPVPAKRNQQPFWYDANDSKPFVAPELETFRFETIRP